LALRAVNCASSPQSSLDQASPAIKARLAATAINLEQLDEIALAALGINIIIKRGAAMLD
jgi:hypothetical protein